jgi:osmotically inducible protein OsmC
MIATFSRLVEVEWMGDVPHGAGWVSAGTAAFSAPVTFPRLGGEAPGTTTPEELLAASHATCFAIALRSVIGQRGGTARRVRLTATVTAEKGSGAIRIRTSHLRAEVVGLEGVEPAGLEDIARAAEEGCTISAAIRAAVRITIEVAAV